MNSSSSTIEQLIDDLFEDENFEDFHKRMSPFNLFEAVGATRSELRHSNFLAYLLSPSRPHGLGARALVALLRSILRGMPIGMRPIPALEILTKDLDDAIVYRERHNIDILIELPALKSVIAIENKVGSKAGDGQLKSYHDFLKSTYPQHRRLMVFLTPEATEPDHDGYVAYDYSRLAKTLENLILEPADSISAHTQLILQHYIEMVRRHIVQDEELRGMALALYERHKEAFDFIFECRPEPASLLNVARSCVESVDGLAVDSFGANVVRFFPKEWDSKLKFIKGEPLQWSKTGRGLLFELKTFPKFPGRVSLALVLGPGDSDMRKKVYDAALSKPELFVGVTKPMGKQWVTIFSRDLQTLDQAKSQTFEAQESNVSFAWSDFQSNQMPNLIKEVLAIDQTLADALL